MRQAQLKSPLANSTGPSPAAATVPVEVEHAIQSGEVDQQQCSALTRCSDEKICVAQGDRLALKVQTGKIISEPAVKEYRLAELLAGINRDNQHAPMDLGAAVGREPW